MEGLAAFPIVALKYNFMGNFEDASIPNRAIRLLEMIRAETESTNQPTILRSAAQRLGVNEASAKPAFRYLVDKGWIDTFKISYTGRINSRGYDALESYQLEQEENNTRLAKQANTSPSPRDVKMEWDVFISHASEDKDLVARPLAERLTSLGLRVWYDELALAMGDSLRRSIDSGLACSRFGVVILSHPFFDKEWPQRELDGLVAREIDGVKVILPVWHNIVRMDVVSRSPSLADRVAGLTSDGLDRVAQKIVQAVRRGSETLVAQTSGIVTSVQVTDATPTISVAQLIGIGPDIVCTGSLTQVEAENWSVSLTQFLIGDLYTLISFIDNFSNEPSGKNYLLSSELGDGRVLAAAPRLTIKADEYRLSCPVAPRFPRVEVQALGSSLASHPDTNDIYADKNGNIARVSGLDYFPQRVREVLSLQLGENPSNRDLGVRFFQYLTTYNDSPWLDLLFKLEVIRHASIPSQVPLTNGQQTPLRCVTRVQSVKLLSKIPISNRLSVRVVFDVQGLGKWENDISVFIPTYEQMLDLDKKIAQQRQAWGNG